MIFPFIAGLISFIALDYLWLAKIAKNFYLSRLSHLAPIENGSLTPYLPAVPLVYIAALIAIYFFVMPFAKTGTSAFIYGALLGFCMYAFYDFTNLATLKEYPWSLAVVDIIWGTLLVGAVSVTIFLIKQSLS